MIVTSWSSWLNQSPEISTTFYSKKSILPSAKHQIQPFSTGSVETDSDAAKVLQMQSRTIVSSSLKLTLGSEVDSQIRRSSP